MSKTIEKMTLSDADFELLMLAADGELADDRQPQAQKLLAESAAAQAVWQDLQLGREMIQKIAEVGVKTARVDFSLVPGQILRKLPDDQALHPVVATPPDRGLVAWIRALGVGKVGLAMACAAAAVALMVVRSGPQAPLQSQDAEIAAVPGTNVAPACEGNGCPDQNPVFIEEMDIESGGIMVHPPREPGGSTIIWHFQDGKTTETEGGEG